MIFYLVRFVAWVGRNNLVEMQEIICSVHEHRNEIVLRLLEFSATDTILYLKECISNEKTLNSLKCAICFANDFLQTKFEEVSGLEVSATNLAQKELLREFLNKLDDVSLAVVYLVATELRSVLLGCLFLCRVFSVKDMFNLAFAEELEEQDKWGCDDCIRQQHAEILEKLMFLEKFCDERSLFKN